MANWSGEERTLIYFAVYQQVFSKSLLVNNAADIDWIGLAKIANIADFNQKTTQKAFATFLSSVEVYSLELKTHLRSWAMTYPLVKTLLFLALTEIAESGAEKTLSHFPEYLRLAQDFTGNESVGLVHAVLLKIFEAHGLDPKKSSEKIAGLPSVNKTEIQQETAAEMEDKIQTTVQTQIENTVQNEAQHEVQNNINSEIKSQTDDEIETETKSKSKPKTKTEDEIQNKVEDKIENKIQNETEFSHAANVQQEKIDDEIDHKTDEKINKKVHNQSAQKHDE